MAKYIKNGTKYTVSVAYSQDRRQQRLDAICAEEQVKLYYPTVLGISQAITNYAIGQPSPDIYHGTIMKEWGRDYPDGQDEFNQILDLLVETGFLKKGKTADNPPIITYSSVDDLERRARYEIKKEGDRKRKQKQLKNGRGTPVNPQENTPETGTNTGGSVADDVLVIPEHDESEPEETETETMPDIQTEEQCEPEETETERKPCTSPLELSGFEANLKAFGEKDFRKSKTKTQQPPAGNVPWMKHANSVLTKCEQEEPEQPETSQLKESCARAGYWNDCKM